MGDSEDESKLREKLSEVGDTLFNKMHILAARDKLLHLKQERQTDLATASVLVGTCHDMCPEHERYFRIETNQVSSFEMDYSSNPAGEMDQKRMVKEYRRSGADQKEPLPHELRPIDVLERTMTYLCLEIVDQYESCTNIGEWFDFVWSRTRSIRKDITQQHLISLQSVSLIEKCARFHILCAFYLCEEEMNAFDPKINEENLSNCLQTLKHFYHDLELRSIVCQNEAEFRAIDVLINLRNSETLSELKHYKPSIRNSQVVRFAVKIYQAFHSKNYIRFFQYARRANFFMSCILNRYFNQFRFEVILILCRAYTTGKSNSVVNYPTENLIKQLVFDDLDDLGSFCESADLEYDPNSVYLRRRNYQPVTEANSRSKLLVRDKLQSTCGRAILGDSTQEVRILSVHTSFDQNNKLIFDVSSLKSTSLNSVSAPETQPTASFFAQLSKPVEHTDNGGGDYNPFNVAKSTFGNSGFGGAFSGSFGFGSSGNNNIGTAGFSFKNQMEKISKTPADTTTFEEEAEEPGSVAASFVLPTPKPVAVISEPKVKSPIESESSIDYAAIIDEIKRKLFNDCVSILIKQQCDTTLANCKRFELSSRKEANRLMYWFHDSILKKLCVDVLQETKIKQQVLVKTANSVVETIVASVCQSTISQAYYEIKRTVLNGRISDFTRDHRVQLFNTILSGLLGEILKSEIHQQELRIIHYRQDCLKRKYWLKWRNYFNSKRRYKFYRDTFPAVAPSQGVDHCPLLELNRNTLIDDQYINTDQGLKRKLVYSKFKDTASIRLYVQQQLKAKQLAPVGQMEQLKRIDYLQRKFFSLWLRNVRKAKRNFVKQNFPAAPPPPPPQFENTNCGQLQFLTIIDKPIEEANASIRKNLLRKLNLDYETTVQAIKRKLSEREQVANEQRVVLAKRTMTHR